MLWWNTSKDTKEVEKELPENLKEFFEQNNPDPKQAGKYEVSAQQKLVDKKLASLSQEYSYDFDVYKKKNTIRNVAMINCSELQLKVIECFKGLDFTSIDNCSKQIKSNKSCIDIQTKAFNKLNYDDCYSQEHCDKIRFVVDHLFTKNLGQYGESMDEQTLAKFEKDLDANFNKLWK